MIHHIRPDEFDKTPEAWPQPRPWAGFVWDYQIPFATIGDAYAALTAFWAPY